MNYGNHNLVKNEDRCRNYLLECWDCSECGVRIDHASIFYDERFYWSYQNSIDWHVGKPLKSCEAIKMIESLA